MCPIPYTSSYRSKSKLLETDEARRTIFRMGPVRAWNNGPGVSGTEPERTARYRDLLYARIEIGCHRSHGIGPGAYGTPGRQESRGASTPHGNT